LSRFRELSLQTAAATCLALNRMISMATAHPAHDADGCCEPTRSQLRLDHLLSLPPKLLTISVIVLAMGMGGCARNGGHSDPNPVQRKVKAPPARSPLSVPAHAEARKFTELRVRRPDPALLAPQPAPNCEFGRADVKAVDPDEWARLKTEYEQQCYRDAEKAARDRLIQLQASSTCEIERAPKERPAR
jgi:hypothetical protein